MTRTPGCGAPLCPRVIAGHVMTFPAQQPHNAGADIPRTPDDTNAHDISFSVANNDYFPPVGNKCV